MIPSLVAFLMLSSLAAYRLAYMVAYETGTFAVFKQIRELSLRTKHEWIAEGFTCPLCISFWFTLVFAIFAMVLYDSTIGVAVWYWLVMFGMTLLWHHIMAFLSSRGD